MKPRLPIVIAGLVIAFLEVVSGANQIWTPDNRDGTYKNPIIFADYSDPDAIRVGDDFYMTASSFNSSPGLPILHSRDLVNWTIITKIDFGSLTAMEKTGLVVMGMDYSYLAVERRESGFKLAKYSCLNAPDGRAETRDAEAALPGRAVLLRISMSQGGFSEFSFSIDGRAFVPIGERFKAREGKWIGAKIGLFCLGARAAKRGYADFDWFRFEARGE